MAGVDTQTVKITDDEIEVDFVNDNGDGNNDQPIEVGFDEIEVVEVLGEVRAAVAHAQTASRTIPAPPPLPGTIPVSQVRVKSHDTPQKETQSDPQLTPTEKSYNAALYEQIRGRQNVPAKLLAALYKQIKGKQNVPADLFQFALESNGFHDVLATLAEKKREAIALHYQWGIPARLNMTPQQYATLFDNVTLSPAGIEKLLERMREGYRWEPFFTLGLPLGYMKEQILPRLHGKKAAPFEYFEGEPAPGLIFVPTMELQKVPPITKAEADEFMLNGMTFLNPQEYFLMLLMRIDQHKQAPEQLKMSQRKQAADLFMKEIKESGKQGFPLNVLRNLMSFRAQDELIMHPELAVGEEMRYSGYSWRFEKHFQATMDPTLDPDYWATIEDPEHPGYKVAGYNPKPVPRPQMVPAMHAIRVIR